MGEHHVRPWDKNVLIDRADWARNESVKRRFLDAENQVGGLERRVHLRTRLRDVDVVSNELRVSNIDTVYSTYADILLQWKDSALTLLYKHMYIITFH